MSFYEAWQIMKVLIKPLDSITPAQHINMVYSTVKLKDFPRKVRGMIWKLWQVEVTKPINENLLLSLFIQPIKKKREYNSVFQVKY